MKKEEALRIIVEAAKNYEENLESKNLLFLYKNRDNGKIEYMETLFEGKNFLHLTGIDTSLQANYFYKKCINNKLSIHEFDFDDRGLAKLKIPILPQIVSVNRVAKMIGTYNDLKPILCTEKLAGNPHACLGFVSGDDYYIPNTALKEDIRDITINQMQIVAIYSKAKKEQRYNNLTYKAKKIKIEELMLSKEIMKKIEML